MTDDSIEKEIEANQRRARDEEDVGLDENVLNREEGGGNFITDLADSIFNPDDNAPDEEAHEYDDNTEAQSTGNGR